MEEFTKEVSTYRFSASTFKGLTKNAPSSRTPLVEDFLKGFLEECEKVACQGAIRYKSALLPKTLEGVDLHYLGDEPLEDYLDYIREWLVKVGFSVEAKIIGKSYYEIEICWGF